MLYLVQISKFVCANILKENDDREYYKRGVVIVSMLPTQILAYRKT